MVMEEYRCIVCGKPIVGKYYKDEWGNMVCYSHYNGVCNCCGRLLMPYEKRYCHNCATTCVYAEDKNLWKTVRKIIAYIEYQFNNIGVYVDMTSVDIQLVSRKTMKHSGTKRTVPLGTARNWESNRRKYHQICLLDGMPKLELAAVLAHELGHVWIFQQGLYDHLSKVENEGICELLSYTMLETVKSKESIEMRRQMNLSKDPVYGEGFRMMKRRLEDNGWSKFIQSLHRYPPKKYRMTS